MIEVSCAAGCGTKKASVKLNDVTLPPEGWLTLSVDKGLGEPPYQENDIEYSAVCCSIGCAAFFFQRRTRQLPPSSSQQRFRSLRNNYVEETRSDVAKRIGFAVLEAIDDLEAEDTMVLLPLNGESYEGLQRVCIALLRLAPEVKELMESAPLH
jgi:hypothetical protein